NARLIEHVAIKASQTGRTEGCPKSFENCSKWTAGLPRAVAVSQQAIADDAFIQDARDADCARIPAGGVLQPLSQDVRPTAIGIFCRAVSVGSGRAECNNRCSPRRNQDIYAGKEWPGSDRLCNREFHCSG